MTELVTATFDDELTANAAIARLIEVGYPSECISVVLSTPDIHDRFRAQTAERHSENADFAKGAAGGGLVGGTLGAIIAGTLAGTAIAGSGIATGGASLLFVAGPLAATIAGGGVGAAAGAVAGGAFGALRGVGEAQDQEELLHQKASAGSIVVAVQAEPYDISALRSILDA